jgi:hypothetical protein
LWGAKSIPAEGRVVVSAGNATTEPASGHSGNALVIHNTSTMTY